MILTTAPRPPTRVRDRTVMETRISARDPVTLLVMEISINTSTVRRTVQQELETVIKATSTSMAREMATPVLETVTVPTVQIPKMRVKLPSSYFSYKTYFSIKIKYFNLNQKLLCFIHAI